MTAINSNRAIRGPVTAVPVVAGKGVRLVADTDNNRWVVEADETVLWEGVATSATLSELPTNFERLRIEFGTPIYSTGENVGRGCIEVSMSLIDPANNGSMFLSTFFNGDGTNHNPYYTSGYVTGVKTTSWTTSWTAFGLVFGTTKNTGTNWFRLNKIVGINRIASN